MSPKQQDITEILHKLITNTIKAYFDYKSEIKIDCNVRLKVDQRKTTHYYITDVIKKPTRRTIIKKCTSPARYDSDAESRNSDSDIFDNDPPVLAPQSHKARQPRSKYDHDGDTDSDDEMEKRQSSGHKRRPQKHRERDISTSKTKSTGPIERRPASDSESCEEKSMEKWRKQTARKLELTSDNDSDSDKPEDNLQSVTKATSDNSTTPTPKVSGPHKKSKGTPGVEAVKNSKASGPDRERRQADKPQQVTSDLSSDDSTTPTPKVHVSHKTANMKSGVDHSNSRRKKPHADAPQQVTRDSSSDETTAPTPEVRASHKTKSSKKRPQADEPQQVTSDSSSDESTTPTPNVHASHKTKSSKKGPQADEPRQVTRDSSSDESTTPTPTSHASHKKDNLERVVGRVKSRNKPPAEDPGETTRDLSSDDSSSLSPISHASSTKAGVKVRKSRKANEQKRKKPRTEDSSWRITNMNNPRSDTSSKSKVRSPSKPTVNPADAEAAKNSKLIESSRKRKRESESQARDAETDSSESDPVFELSDSDSDFELEKQYRTPEPLLRRAAAKRAHQVLISQLTPKHIDKKRRRSLRRCGHCEACLTKEDCGECRYCKDKPRFGGENKLRQKCKVRQCYERSNKL